MGMRINEIAKEYGKNNKELISLLESQGIKGKTHSSGLSDKEEKLLRRLLEGEPKIPPKPRAELVHKTEQPKADAAQKSKSQAFPKAELVRRKDQQSSPAADGQAKAPAEEQKNPPKEGVKKPESETVVPENASAQKSGKPKEEASAKPKKTIISLLNPQGGNQGKSSQARTPERNRSGGNNNNAGGRNQNRSVPYHPIRSSIKAADPNSEEFLKKYITQPAPKPKEPAKPKASEAADQPVQEALPANEAIPAPAQNPAKSEGGKGKPQGSPSRQEKPQGERKPKDSSGKERRGDHDNRQGAAGARGKGAEGAGKQSTAARDKNAAAAAMPGDRRQDHRGGERGANRNASSGNRSFGQGAQGAGKGQGKQLDKRRQAQDKDRSKKKNLTIEDAEVKQRTKKAGRFIKPPKEEVQEEQIKVITIPETLTIKELA
ncbi:MAG: translation initiation factor IF-2 N-terminal domain-containing protein, partial [Lachnospiraceae bacterium]|nr:translation initiation factor IF-2 N-terminal domain-containing protein [Lachnospiraceae bacterium]